MFRSRECKDLTLWGREEEDIYTDSTLERGQCFETRGTWGGNPPTLVSL